MDRFAIDQLGMFLYITEIFVEQDFNMGVALYFNTELRRNSMVTRYNRHLLIKEE